VAQSISLNAVAQAYKERNPACTRVELFAALQVPACMTAANRYWAESYNIRPWHEREEWEVQAARGVCQIAEREGITLREALARENARLAS
jgi:hypothetical protein